MHRPLVVALLGLLAGPSASFAGSSALPRSAPEEQGVSSAGVLAFVRAANEQIEGMHSFVLVRHGHVVAEGWWTPYDAASPHQLYSLTKSFTSTAVGLAVADGKMTIDDLVLPLFPAEAPAEPSDNLKAMRVRDLLSMSTGHHSEAPFRDTPRWTASFLAHPVAHKPGTFFLYNTPASNTLSAIVQQAVGESLADYLRPRLFEPLGIENPRWDLSPDGIPIGGYGLHLRTEDIAKFGQLYLRKGEWQGRQLVPAAWVEAATSRQVSNGSKPESDWEQGYGYQFWRCRYRAYRGDGAFGQFCVVLPEQDAVVAITSGVKSMQAVLDLVWGRLLQALGPGGLPDDPAARDELRAALGRLTLATPRGAAAPAVSAKATGRRFVFPSNEQRIEALGLERKGEAVTLVVRLGGPSSAWPAGGTRGSGGASPTGRSPSSQWRRAERGRAPTRTRRSSPSTRRRSPSPSRCGSRATSSCTTPSTTWPSGPRSSPRSWEPPLRVRRHPPRGEAARGGYAGNEGGTGPPGLGAATATARPAPTAT